MSWTLVGIYALVGLPFLSDAAWAEDAENNGATARSLPADVLPLVGDAPGNFPVYRAQERCGGQAVWGSGLASTHIRQCKT